MPEFDDRSETHLASLRPKAQPYFRALLRRMKARAAVAGLEVRFTSGHRTAQEQDALYNKGRTPESKARGEKIVTDAKAWQSNHNYGLAVDVTVFQGTRPLWDSPLYRELGALAGPLGLLWGGDWKKPDLPHYELPLDPVVTEGKRVGKRPAELRQLVLASGWPGIDGRIPVFQEPAPVLPVAEPITVFQEDADPDTAPLQLTLAAWFYRGRSWVAIRDWTQQFGGSIEQVEGTWHLVLHGETVPLATELLQGRTVARFGDINEVLGWNFSFDGLARPRRLTIHHDRIEPA